ncbi:MAG TPA: acyltransferase [Caulobacteraceae bacterium]|nr:acyltransferase [Caulobacteraceae bacterium]
MILRKMRSAWFHARRLANDAFAWALAAIAAPEALAKAHERRQKRALAYCGRNVLIRQPTVIEVPHKVRIEDNVTFASFVHIWGNAGVRIGARTMIASHVVITTASHDPDAPQMNLTLVELPIDIGNDVWIGAQVSILPGVTIGAHAVIAAGSVVRDDVEPYTVVAGIPARVVRRKDRPAQTL